VFGPLPERWAARPRPSVAKGDANAPAAAYSCKFAHQRYQRRRQYGRLPPKLAPQSALLKEVCRLLRKCWSPQQIAAYLSKVHGTDRSQRVSHETIYTCIYAQPKGELRRELIACLRMARARRWPRSRGTDRRGEIADLLSIHVRPPQVNERQFPGHWEGDLIKGALNLSAVGTLVERSSRLLMLVKLPHPNPATAAHVLQAFSDKLLSIAQPMRQTLTYDRGKEMMATLIPALGACASRITSGERRLAERLEQKLDDDYLLWYDVPVGPKHAHPDFVVMHPRRGILILEVKDWRLETPSSTANKQTWDHPRPRHPQNRPNPLEQARQYAHQVVDALECDPQLVQADGAHKGKLAFPGATAWC
jgi:hypothetical protein